MAGHILLAEDDKALSALMQDFFRAAGVAVTPAYDGEQALVLAQAHAYVIRRAVWSIALCWGRHRDERC